MPPGQVVISISVEMMKSEGIVEPEMIMQPSVNIGRDWSCLSFKEVIAIELLPNSFSVNLVPIVSLFDVDFPRDFFECNSS